MKIQTKIVVGSLASIALLAGLLFVAPKAFATTVTSQSIAAPLFAKPGSNSLWDDVRGAGHLSVPFVIANANNGPGVKADPLYATAISKNAGANIRTLGYVQTNYQTRTFNDTYTDVDNWYKFYPQTSGIYIDLLKEGGQDEACYVAALYTHVKNTHPNDLVILGAGGHLSPTYEPYGDIFVNAASDYATYKAWSPQYKGFEDKTQYENRFMHLIYGVTSDQYSSAFSAIRNNNAGWLFMTDKTAPTPFSATPSFWQNEASDVGALPATTIPNRGKTTLPRGCISLSSSADNTLDNHTAKQSTTTSKVTVNNTSVSFNSEPATTLNFMSMPKGVTIDAMSAQGWSCDAVSKSCSYASVMTPASSAPVISTSLTANCDYAGGNALLRLTNFSGNRWDLKIPIQTPFGCEASTAAGKLNSDKSGQITTQTTQSVETTPAIVPLGGNTNDNASRKQTPVKKSNSVIKAIAIALIIVILLGLGGWGGWIWYKRQRYSVKL